MYGIMMLTWATTGMGKGAGALAPGNVVKCFFCAADAVYSLSRRSIYALF